MRAYYEIGKQIASVQAPNRFCTLNADVLSSRLNALGVGAARDMTTFAQTLEPELSDESIGGKT